LIPPELAYTSFGGPMVVVAMMNLGNIGVRRWNLRRH
jgi:chromate transport protein ChrA